MRLCAAYITNSPGLIERIYPENVREKLDERLELLPGVLTEEALAARAEETRNVRVLLSTWGMPALTRERIAESFPNLLPGYAPLPRPRPRRRKSVCCIAALQLPHPRGSAGRWHDRPHGRRAPARI